MDYEPKYTEENEDRSDLTFQIEEGMLEDIKDSTLEIEEAQAVAYMLEDNAHWLPSGRGSFTAGGYVTSEEGVDKFFEVTYSRPDGDIPTYYKYEDVDVDVYLDHINSLTALKDYDYEISDPEEDAA